MAYCAFKTRLDVKGDVALVAGIIALVLGSLSFLVGDDYVIPYLVRGLIVLGGSATIILTIFWSKIFKRQKIEIVQTVKQPSLGRQERYEKLAKHAFRPLSECCTRLNIFRINAPNDLALDDSHIGDIINSSYFHEAREHLKNDLEENIIQPEELHGKILQYNAEVEQFLNVTIPHKVRQEFGKIPNLEISEAQNELPNNSIIKYTLLGNLSKHFLKAQNPDLFYENGMLSEGHGIVILAVIPPELEQPVRNTIRRLKLDYGLSSVLDGTPLRSGVWNRRSGLIENGNNLAKFINDNILFRIDRKTYSTTCEECINLCNRHQLTS
jgi:hypothetical protein